MISEFNLSDKVVAKVESYCKTHGGKQYQDVYIMMDGKRGMMQIGTFQCATPEIAKDKAVDFLRKVAESIH